MTSDYNLTKLFFTKDVHLYPDDKNIQIYFTVKLCVMKDFYQDHDWNWFYHFFILHPEKLQQVTGITNDGSSWDLILKILFQLGMYKELSFLYDIVWSSLNKILPELVIEAPYVKVNNITMTAEIWDYVSYILKLSYGEKVNEPLVFSSEEARKFFMAQQANDARINKMRAQKTDSEGLIKAFLAITYKFPSLTIDYLFDQTMAQIHWLQKMAAGAVSYEVNAQAFAAGNIKKGKKLDFFIK